MYYYTNQELCIPFYKKYDDGGEWNIGTVKFYIWEGCRKLKIKI